MTIRIFLTFYLGALMFVGVAGAGAYRTLNQLHAQAAPQPSRQVAAADAQPATAEPSNPQPAITQPAITQPAITQPAITRAAINQPTAAALPPLRHPAASARAAPAHAGTKRPPRTLAALPKRLPPPPHRAVAPRQQEAVYAAPYNPPYTTAPPVAYYYAYPGSYPYQAGGAYYAASPRYSHYRAF